MREILYPKSVTLVHPHFVYWKTVVMHHQKNWKKQQPQEIIEHVRCVLLFVKTKGDQTIFLCKTNSVTNRFGENLA
jgi:hypothetical protein